MRFPCFNNSKNVTPKSPRPQSQGFNIFSSESRTGKFSSGKKMSAREYGENSSMKSVSIEIDRVEMNCPLPSDTELEIVFHKFDADGDGKISPSEMRHVMQSLGHDATEDELRRIMAEADSDGDGYVDLSEFVAVNTKGVDSAARLQDLKNAFKMFDMDGNGSISANELHDVLRKLGESCSLDECRRMIGGVDADGDGQVCFDEFFAMMSTTITR